MMAAVFLQRSRHKSVFYFRRKVPLDLRSAFGLSVIYKTLATSVKRDAVVLARALAAKTDQLFCKVRAMGDDKDDDILRIDYGLLVDMDELTGRKRVRATDVLEGEDTRAVDAVFDLQQRILGGDQQASANSSAPAGPTLQEAVNLFMRDNATRIKPRTKRRYFQVFTDVIDHFGADTQLRAIDQERFNDYADRINGADQAQATRSLYITVAARLFKWSRLRKRTTQVITTDTLKPKRTRPARLDRAAFTLDELRVLLENALASKDEKRLAKFWITVVSAFVGGRVEELAQLDFDGDLKQTADGNWYVRIQENQDERDWRLKQSVKRLSSWRDVPVHSALVRHGFIEFLRNEKKAGAVRPFVRYWEPQLDEQFNGAIYSHEITKWGGRQLAKLRKNGKITTPKVTYFHSFRHTLATELAKQGVGEEVRAAIAGQEYGGINNELYSKLKDSPDALAPLMERHMTAYAVLIDDVLRGTPLTLT